MKKLILLFVPVLFLALTACEKDTLPITRNGKIPDPDTTHIPGDYTWNGCSPKPLTFVSSSKVSGYTDVWDYTFSGHLDNAQINPVGVTLTTPHVGPNGTTIYENVSNDATYTLRIGAKGSFTLVIRTADVTSSGCKLKFNLAVGSGSSANWFLANGSFVQNPSANHTSDDMQNNIYCIVFKGGAVTPGVN